MSSRGQQRGTHTILILLRWLLLDAGVLRRLEEYAAHFADDCSRPRQRAWCEVYLAGLMQDGERKSIEPLSRRVTLPVALAGTQDPDQGLQQFDSIT